MARPTLIVGDVQGDFERLEEALRPFPEDEVDTVFLGDFFQGGRPGAGGGAAAARIARGRRNSRHVLGNHDAFLLAVLEQQRGQPDAGAWRSRDGRPLDEVWLSRRGDWADLSSVAGDGELEAWLRSLPLLARLDDGTLVQHTDDDGYMGLGDSIEAVNRTVAGWLASPGGVLLAMRALIGRGALVDPDRVDAYLRHWGATRIVHGHSPHWGDGPRITLGGRVLGFDGRFSRYWTREPGEGTGPIGATVALLPPLDGDQTVRASAARAAW